MDRDRIEELFAPLGPVAAKRMFGGFGVYADGVFFAICQRDEIYLKVDESSRPHFEAAGARPFVYQGKNRPVALSYYRLPDEGRWKTKMNCAAGQDWRSTRRAAPRLASRERRVNRQASAFERGEIG